MWLSSKSGNFQLVVLPRNYAPDYAPFTLNSEGHLVKIPVSLKVDQFWCNTVKILFNIVKILLKFWSNTVKTSYRCLGQVELSQILEIDEVGQVLANQFTLYMTWYFKRSKIGLDWWISNFSDGLLFSVCSTHWTFPKPHFRFDFRLQFHNMKENINMNTLSALEKKVTKCWQNFSYTGR